jgi:uncharacterized phage infection (PIP) family protein YhgE
MDDPMLIAGAVVLVIASVGSWYIQIINAKSAARLEEFAKINDSKNDRIIEQGVEIHTLTNSNLSKVTAELVTALAEIKNLERMITAQNKAKEVADTLATAHVVPFVNSVNEKLEVLESIKENIANTVDAVKDLKERRKL